VQRTMFLIDLAFDWDCQIIEILPENKHFSALLEFSG
jgi:hypothetical protein